MLAALHQKARPAWSRGVSLRDGIKRSYDWHWLFFTPTVCADFFYQGLSGAGGQGDNYDVDTGSMLCPVFFAHVLSIRIPILLRSSSSPGSSPR